MMPGRVTQQRQGLVQIIGLCVRHITSPVLDSI